jgi:hypothetical protein
MNKEDKIHIKKLIERGEIKEAIIFISEKIDNKDIFQNRILNEIRTHYYSNLRMHSLKLISPEKFLTINSSLRNLIFEVFIDGRIINKIKFIEVLNLRKAKNNGVDYFELVIKNNQNTNQYLDAISLKSFMPLDDFKKKYPQNKKTLGTATIIGGIIGGAIILGSAIILTGGAAAPVIPALGVEIAVSLGIGAASAGAVGAGIAVALAGGLIDLMSEGKSIILKGDAKNSLDGKVRETILTLSIKEDILFYELIIPCNFFLEPTEICSLNITLNTKKPTEPSEKFQFEQLDNLPIQKESQIIFFCDSGVFSSSETEVESLKNLKDLL